MSEIVMPQNGQPAHDYAQQLIARDAIRELMKTNAAPRRQRRAKHTGTNPQKPPLELDSLEPGTLILIEGEEGQFVFKSFQKNGDINVHGGTKGSEKARSFSPAKRVYPVA